MAADDAHAPPSIARLQGKLTDDARRRITEYLNSFVSFEPALGLLYGDLDGAVAGRPSWSLIAYPPQLAEDLISMYAAFGAVVSHELDGFRVIVPQIGHVKELDAGTLDFVGNRLCAVDG